MSLLQKLLPIDDLIETVRRFPLSVACALALFVIAIFEIHGVWEIDEQLLARLGTVLACSYFWLGIARVLRESLALDAMRQHVIGAVGVIGFTALAWSGDQWGMHFCFLFPVLLLSLMFAPYLKGGDDLSVWFYNRRLWVGVVISYIALLLLAGGACMALWAVGELFNLDIEDELFADIWAFAGLVVGPVYALYWVPERFSYTKEDCNDPKGLKFIVNWISAPMVFVYLAILYAYFAKILITGEVPNGHLAYLISGFIGAGIVTYLAAHPLRNEGTVQLKAFYRVFFAAMIVPVGFHIYAIWERIAAYGVTEQRYMLGVSAVWFAFLALGNLRGRMDIRFIPMVLAGLMLLASFGPWGAVSASGSSQFARLEALVAEHGLVVDGKAVKAEGDLPFEARSNISSILEYMCRTDRGAMIEDWFTVKDGEEFKCSTHDMTGQMGFEFISKWRQRREKDDYFYLNSAYRKSFVDIRGFDYLVERISTAIKVEKVAEEDERRWEFDYAEAEFGQALKVFYDESGILRIEFGEGRLIELDMNAFSEEKHAYEENNRTLIYEGETEQVVFRLDFETIKGERDESGKLHAESFTFDLYYRLKE